MNAEDLMVFWNKCTCYFDMTIEEAIQFNIERCKKYIEVKDVDAAIMMLNIAEKILNDYIVIDKYKEDPGDHPHKWAGEKCQQ